MKSGLSIVESYNPAGGKWYIITWCYHRRSGFQEADQHPDQRTVSKLKRAKLFLKTRKGRTNDDGPGIRQPGSAGEVANTTHLEPGRAKEGLPRDENRVGKRAGKNDSARATDARGRNRGRLPESARRFAKKEGAARLTETRQSLGVSLGASLPLKRKKPGFPGFSAGRSGVIRTLDPHVPNVVRYQTALHSVTSGASIEQHFRFHKRPPQKKHGALQKFEGLKTSPAPSSPVDIGRFCNASDFPDSEGFQPIFFRRFWR